MDDRYFDEPDGRDPYGYEAEDACYMARRRPIDDEGTLDGDLTPEEQRREACDCDSCLFGGPCEASRAS